MSTTPAPLTPAQKAKRMGNGPATQMTTREAMAAQLLAGILANPHFVGDGSTIHSAAVWHADQLLLVLAR